MIFLGILDFSYSPNIGFAALCWVFILAMTKLDRIKAKIAHLREDRRVAIRKCDMFKLAEIDRAIHETEAALEEAKSLEPRRLSEVLSHDDIIRDDLYRKLLKCSLAADFCNNCVEDVKATLKKHGLNDFSFRRDVEELCKLSQKIASLVIIPNQQVLTDMMTDNDEFIDTCDTAADKHLKEKLKL